MAHAFPQTVEAAKSTTQTAELSILDAILEQTEQVLRQQTTEAASAATQTTRRRKTSKTSRKTTAPRQTDAKAAKATVSKAKPRRVKADAPKAAPVRSLTIKGRKWYIVDRDDDLVGLSSRRGGAVEEWVSEQEDLKSDSPVIVDRSQPLDETVEDTPAKTDRPIIAGDVVEYTAKRSGRTASYVVDRIYGDRVRLKFRAGRKRGFWTNLSDVKKATAPKAKTGKGRRYCVICGEFDCNRGPFAYK